MWSELERSFSFTLRGSRQMLATVNGDTFQDQEADVIFQTLRDQMVYVPFCDYLKRYVYLTSGMFGSYLQVPQEEYENTIVDAFRESGAPTSLKRSCTPPRNRIRNWLQQSSVRRHSVLMLGFGLSMPEKDVNGFLTNALHDHQLDPEDPLEAICAYCYRHGYRYPKMRQLQAIFDASQPGSLNEAMIAEAQPVDREASRQIIEEDTALLRPLVERKGYVGATGQRTRTLRHFRRLYDQAGQLVRSNRDFGEKKAGPVELEDVLCAAVPRDRHGNLVPQLRSDLRDKITGKRFSRQHLYELNQGIVEPDRYDLITLRFLICAEDPNQPEDPKARCALFVEDMNRILADCGFGSLYTADPLECFLLMCVLSENPLWTYSDVMEKAYEGEP